VCPKSWALFVLAAAEKVPSAECHLYGLRGICGRARAPIRGQSHHNLIQRTFWAGTASAKIPFKIVELSGLAVFDQQRRRNVRPRRRRALAIDEGPRPRSSARVAHDRRARRRCDGRSVARESKIVAAHDRIVRADPLNRCWFARRAIDIEPNGASAARNVRQRATRRLARFDVDAIAERRTRETQTEPRCIAALFLRRGAGELDRIAIARAPPNDGPERTDHIGALILPLREAIAVDCDLAKKISTRSVDAIPENRRRLHRMKRNFRRGNFRCFWRRAANERKENQEAHDGNLRARAARTTGLIGS